MPPTQPASLLTADRVDQVITFLTRRGFRTTEGVAPFVGVGVGAALLAIPGLPKDTAAEIATFVTPTAAGVVVSVVRLLTKSAVARWLHDHVVAPLEPPAA